MRQFVLTAMLRDDVEAVASYDRYHADIWPEVIEDNARAGVRRFAIHRRGRQLVLVIEADDTFSLESYAGALDSPRTREWLTIMDSLVLEVDGEQPGTRWAPLIQLCSESCVR